MPYKLMKIIILFAFLNGCALRIIKGDQSDNKDLPDFPLATKESIQQLIELCILNNCDHIRAYLYELDKFNSDYKKYKGE